jgi:xanthine dehydrogenase molybdopterin-binding subunit B
MFSSININVRRLGGGYGAKISRSALIATSCALAAHILCRPVRFVMNLETNMAAIGKRCRVAFDYEVSD